MISDGDWTELHVPAKSGALHSRAAIGRGALAAAGDPAQTTINDAPPTEHDGRIVRIVKRGRR